MKGITVDMTGIVFFLLLTGVVFMVGSFFITERLSPSELNKIAELSKDELGRIIDGALADAKSKVEESIEAQIDASSEQVERALEKETNEKIMAISEYSDTVMENMNKTHNEIMFLYNMLNDKHRTDRSCYGFTEDCSKCQEHTGRNGKEKSSGASTCAKAGAGSKKSGDKRAGSPGLKKGRRT